MMDSIVACILQLAGPEWPHVVGAPWPGRQGASLFSASGTTCPPGKEANLKLELLYATCKQTLRNIHDLSIKIDKI